MRKRFQIAELISRFLSGSLTEEEESELIEWRESSPENEKLFKQINDTENFADYYRESKKYSLQDGWKSLNRKIHLINRRRLILKFSRYAAALILPAVVGVWLITTRPSHTKTVTEQMEEQAIEILPGEKKAVLTLGSGETIDLNTTAGKMMREKDGTAIRIDSASLNYHSGQTTTAAEKEIYNKVETPRGGEYSLVLSDGSKVHLNAMSTLTFPVSFTGDRRMVELSGEAYFVVAGSDKPFIIKINSMEVGVLGTTFNISAYPDEDCRTTLVDGSVKIQTDAGTNCILSPSQQACVEQGTGDLSVRTVNTSLYTSWVDGKIHFKDERLEDIMNALSRWYDMEVFYREPSVGGLRFGCNVNRHKDITPFLELLEKTGKVSITIKGKTIYFNHSN